MVQTEFPDDYYLTTEQLKEKFSETGVRVEQGYEQHYECDFCSKGVPYSKEPRVALYFADRMIFEDNPRAKIINERNVLTHIATYCEECSSRLLLFPHEGTTEARAMVTITEDYQYEDIKFTDISPKDDGIPWDPLELQAKLTGIPRDGQKAIGAQSDVLWGPENFVVIFMSMTNNMDIREVYDYEGNIDPQVLGRARKELEKVQDEYVKGLSKGKSSKRTYQDIVRD